jgi:excisionase family DNA binding protein
MTLERRGKYWHYAFQMAGKRYRGSTKETVKARAAQFQQILMGRISEAAQSVMIERAAPLPSDWGPVFLERCAELVAAKQIAKLQSSETPELLTEAEASSLVKVKVETLRGWRTQRRELPFVMIGRKVCYVKSDVLAYIEQNRRAPIDREVLVGRADEECARSE